MKKNPAIDLLGALKAIAAPAVVPRGFYTIAELSRQTGISPRSMLRKIEAMGAECRMFKVHAGLVCRPVPHYSLK